MDFDVPVNRQLDAALLHLRTSIGTPGGAAVRESGDSPWEREDARYSPRFRGHVPVPFPSFDIAYAVLWQKTHPDTAMRSVDSRQETVDRAEPGKKEGTERQRDQETGGWLEPGSLVSQLLDDAGKLPIIGLIPRVAKLFVASPEPQDPRTLEPSLRSWWERRGERELEDLPQMEPAAIVEQLPKLWASDLKDWLQAASHKPQALSHEDLKSKGKSQEPKAKSEESGIPQVQDDIRWTKNDKRRTRSAVLFIDSYEKLWGPEDGGRKTVDGRQKTDEWVRELVKRLPEVLWIVCGRQKLRWEEAEKEWADVLSQHELGALPEHSAREFLGSCGITDEPTQDAIAKGSQGLPHYLNLAVDTFQVIEQSGQRAGSVQSLFSGAESSDSPEELFAQFVRHLDQPEIATLEVLSASRFWNYGLFEHLVTEYQTGYPLTAYDDLRRFSFVGEGAAPETRTMHELMREALQEHQEPELRKRVHLFLHEYYARQLEGLDVKGITEQHKTALAEAFYHGQQARSAEELWAWFKTAHGAFAAAGQYRFLVPLLREVVTSLEGGTGEAHPSVAESLFELARQLDAIGEYDEAEPFYRRALAMAEEGHGPEDRLVLASLSSLAELLRKRARYEEAEITCRRAVELCNRLGGSAVDQAEALDSLAAVLTEEDKYAEAEGLFRRALAICERELGPEHRQTGMKLSNLGGLLWTQRRFDEAEPVFRQALAINENALGSNHSDLVFTLDGLANTLFGLGRYAEAEPLLRRSLRLCEENLGPEHPDTAICMNNLGTLLGRQKRLDEAEPLQRRAFEAHQKKMGPDHPLTIRMANNLIVGMVKRGSYAEAEPLILSALAAREKKLGSDNPATFFLAHWGGVMYSKQGRYAEAESFLRRAVDVTTRIRGPEHPDTLGSLSALGVLRERQGRYGEAEPLFRDVLEKRERVLGSEHPDVADTASRLAGLCSRDGRYGEAEALYRRALAIREKVFGSDHVFVAETLEGLAKVCEQTGRAAEAQELTTRAKSIRDKNAQTDQAQASSSS